MKVGYTLGIKLDDPRIIPTSEEELSEHPHPRADLQDRELLIGT